MKNNPRALGVAEAAEYTGIAVRTLRDRRWRKRVGLCCTRIGGKVLFLVRDLDLALARGRERSPDKGGDGGAEQEVARP
jgi:hypothetical protein